MIRRSVVLMCQYSVNRLARWGIFTEMNETGHTKLGRSKLGRLSANQVMPANVLYLYITVVHGLFTYLSDTQSKLHSPVIHNIDRPSISHYATNNNFV